MWMILFLEEVTQPGMLKKNIRKAEDQMLWLKYQNIHENVDGILNDTKK